MAPLRHLSGDKECTGQRTPGPLTGYTKLGLQPWPKPAAAELKPASWSSIVRCEVWPGYDTRTRVKSSGVKKRWAFFVARLPSSATPGLGPGGRSRTCTSVETTPKYRPPTTPNTVLCLLSERGNRRQPPYPALPAELRRALRPPVGLEPTTWALEVRSKAGLRHPFGNQVKLSTGVKGEKHLLYQTELHSAAHCAGGLIRFERMTRRTAFRRHPAGCFFQLKPPVGQQAAGVHFPTEA